MRKEDRIRQQQSQSTSEHSPENAQPRPGEQMKGSASADQPNRPKPGKLPLPD